ncbi:MAG: hypothetical protein IJC48_00975 [Clostridia bacterium]|nr:hypothetical protein [Clostridia bacterium]
MKTFHFTEKPIEIFGLDVIDRKKEMYHRLPDSQTKAVSEAVCSRSKTAGGARVRFRTDSKTLHVKMSLGTISPDICMPMCGSAGADVMLGAGLKSRFLGLVNPLSYDNHFPEAAFTLSGDIEQVTINLPRNEILTGLEIGIDDGAQLLAPLPYSRPGKLCFYGSSITEGGCSTRVSNAYTACVARWLDMDYVNYGFSGAARGEIAMADIIAKRDFAAFIYDYDHNAPSAEFLKDTHQPFFRHIRKAKPELPILILSRPDFDINAKDSVIRRDVIMKTYADARNEGDNNVWFLDGEQFFVGLGVEMCTVDRCHPNDLGFFRMAEAVYRMLDRILER